MITYENLRMELPLQLKHIDSFKLEQKCNCHCIVVISGEVDSAEALNKVKQISTEDICSVYINQEIIFCGVITNLVLKQQAKDCSIEITMYDYSYFLDIQKKSRSFQDIKVSYIEIMEKVADGAEGRIHAMGIENGYSNAPVVQFEETDWEFLIRMASILGSCILPDVRMARARLYIGQPIGYTRECINYSYGIKKEIENKFYSYSIETEEVFEIGDKVNLQGQVLTVQTKTMELKQEKIVFSYLLHTEYKQYPLLKNKTIKGNSLEGTVLEIVEDKVKIHLSIDQDQATDKAFPYLYGTPYTAEGNTGWYFMPEIGQKVLLYFPTDTEQDAFARKEIESYENHNPYKENEEVQYWGISSETTWKAKKEEMTFQAEENEVYIRMSENEGVNIISKTGIRIVAGKKLSIKSQTFTAYAKKRILLATKKSNVKIDALVQIKSS